MLLALLLIATAKGPPSHPAPSPAPPYSALVSPTESARYALVHGCLLARQKGVGLTQVPSHFIRLDKKTGAYRMMGAGRVELSQKNGSGCYMRVGLGDTDQLRVMVLGVLAAEGRVGKLFDSGPGSRDSSGSFRQETHCATLGGKTTIALISTSNDRKRPRLQLSLVDDSDGSCARIARP
jgi:hypothetical protein